MAFWDRSSKTSIYGSEGCDACFTQSLLSTKPALRGSLSTGAELEVQNATDPNAPPWGRVVAQNSVMALARLHWTNRKLYLCESCEANLYHLLSLWVLLSETEEGRAWVAKQGDIEFKELWPVRLVGSPYRLYAAGLCAAGAFWVRWPELAQNLIPRAMEPGTVTALERLGQAYWDR